MYSCIRHHSENRVLATVVIFISILSEASPITLTYGDVIDMIGLVDMTGVLIIVSKDVLVCSILVIKMLDIIGSEGIVVFGGVRFAVALEWKQVLSYASGYLYLSLRCNISAMQ